MSTSAAINVSDLPAPSLDSLQSKPGSKQRWSRNVAADIVGLLDIVAVELGAILPAWIYATYGGVKVDWLLIVQSALAAAIIVNLCLRSWSMYDTAKMHDFPTNPGRLFGALSIGLIAVVGLGLPHVLKNAHLWVWYASWMSASYTLILLNRWISNLLLAKLVAKGRFDQRIAVFGAGAIARRVHDYLSNPALGIRFVGVYDDRMGQDRINPEGLTVAGKLAELQAAARNDEIDQIVIALPQGADQRIAAVTATLEQLPVSVHIVTHIASDLVERETQHRVSSIGPVGLMDVKKKPLADWAPTLKRIEDYTIGSLLLILALPLFPLIALAIKLESKGPVFFVQRRRGLNQRVMQIYKFRTMTVTEDGSDVRQVSKDDPRVTTVGRVLRRTSMDELPQLLNVLKGEMSLVGPRPHALVHDEQYGEMLEQYASRHQVKPGITGLAQVRGFRGETPSSDKMRARVSNDIEYINNWSLALDLKILVKTFWVVLTGKNAY